MKIISIRKYFKKMIQLILITAIPFQEQELVIGMTINLVMAVDKKVSYQLLFERSSCTYTTDPTR